MPKPSKDSAGGSTRREFARALAFAAAVPLVAELSAAGADDPPPPTGPAGALAQARALMQVLQDRHGKHLDKDQLEGIQHSIAGGLVAAERMYAVPLTNGDEPACDFSADVR